MEAIGIQYSDLNKTGHVIAVFDRVGDIADPRTWGGDCFVVDMWYFNLGMRPDFLYTDRSYAAYIQKEILAKGRKTKLLSEFN